MVSSLPESASLRTEGLGPAPAGFPFSDTGVGVSIGILSSNPMCTVPGTKNSLTHHRLAGT